MGVGSGGIFGLFALLVILDGDPLTMLETLINASLGIDHHHLRHQEGLQWSRSYVNSQENRILEVEDINLVRFCNCIWSFGSVLFVEIVVVMFTVVIKIFLRGEGGNHSCDNDCDFWFFWVIKFNWGGE